MSLYILIHRTENTGTSTEDSSEEEEEDEDENEDSGEEHSLNCSITAHVFKGIIKQFAFLKLGLKSLLRTAGREEQYLGGFLASTPGFCHG